MADATATARKDIRRLLRAPEPEVLAPLLEAAALDADSRGRVEARALAMLAELREAQGKGWVNQFLQEYRLNTQEGVALLSLAEAFLRVPDPETADSLIADKLGEGDWRAHKGKANSTLVNTATWGLVIGRALTSDSEHASALRRLMSRAGEPFVRQGVGAAMRMMGEIFVMGRNIDEAIARMKKRENKGFTASFDMLGEAARTFPDAERYYRSYEDAIRAVGKAAGAGHSISVKLSALHPRYEVAQYERCVPALIGQVEALATLAAKLGIPFTIDAEETERLEMSLDIIEAVAGLPALKGWDGLGMAIQAYGKRARPTVAWADALGGEDRPPHRRSPGQGRLLGHRDQAHAGAGARRLPALHPQGGDRRLLSRLREGHAGGEEHLSGLRHPQCADRRHHARMGGRQPRLRVPAAARHGRGAL